MLDINKNLLLKDLKDTSVVNLKYLDLGFITFEGRKISYHMYLVPYKFTKVRKIGYCLCPMISMIVLCKGTSLYTSEDFRLSWFEMITNYDIVVVEDFGITAPESMKTCFFCCYLDQIYNEEPGLLDLSISFLYDREWCSVVMGDSNKMLEEIPIGVQSMLEVIKNKM